VFSSSPYLQRTGLFSSNLLWVRHKARHSRDAVNPWRVGGVADVPEPLQVGLVVGRGGVWLASGGVLRTRRNKPVQRKTLANWQRTQKVVLTPAPIELPYSTSTDVITTQHDEMSTSRIAQTLTHGLIAGAERHSESRSDIRTATRRDGLSYLLALFWKAFEQQQRQQSDFASLAVLSFDQYRANEGDLATDLMESQLRCCCRRLTSSIPISCRTCCRTCPNPADCKQQRAQQPRGEEAGGSECARAVICVLSVLLQEPGQRQRVGARRRGVVTDLLTQRSAK
jgi:hypothetical protein